jgi:hypothetical protein
LFDKYKGLQILSTPIGAIFSRRLIKMRARILTLDSLKDAMGAIEEIGASNSEFMATRAIQINCRLDGVPAKEAREIKKVYNEVGAEAAISHGAFYDEGAQFTDMIIMGTLAHHREVRRVLGHREDLKDLIMTLKDLVEGFVGEPPENTAT